MNIQNIKKKKHILWLVKRFKTLKQNNIKSGSLIMLNIYDE